MWSTLATIVFLAPSTFSTTPNISSMFNNNQVIFTSTFNITKILVPTDASKYVQAESSDLPLIFFTVIGPYFDGGSCIYVLKGLAAYEILEGGRDSTADYGSDCNVYFGSINGIYKYNRESLSAKKLGPFRDNIIQLQKANGTDKIYFLTESHKLFKVEKNGTVRTKVSTVTCATQFVLDTSNNIYYVECENQLIHIIKPDESKSNPISVTEDFQDVKLIRPAFIMDESIPLFGDGSLHILYVNGTCEKTDLHMTEKPSAFSVDAALYLAIALNGKIYEYNVMEVLLKSMFGLGTFWPREVNRIIMSVIGSSKDNLVGYYKGWHQN